MGRITTATMNERSARTSWQMVYRDPTDVGEFLVTSSQGCLTHIIRWAIDHPRRVVERLDRPPIIHEARRSYQAQCGMALGTVRSIVVDPADELFGCHACITACLRYGLPTFRLLPSTGCEATGGARYRKPIDDGFATKVPRGRPRPTHADPASTLRMVEGWIEVADKWDAAAAAPPSL